MTHRTCPHCGSSRLYESHLRGFSEQLVYIFGGHLCRCLKCRARWLWLGPLVTRVDGEQVDSMTTAVPTLCLAGLASGGIVLWLVLKIAQLRG